MDYKYLEFIYAFKKIFDNYNADTALNKIKDNIYELVFSMGYKPMSKTMFNELLSLITEDEDSIIDEENKSLAFILNLIETDIYRIDFKNYSLLDNDLEHIYELLYQNQVFELNNIFNDENNNLQFFYCPKKMLDVFIKHNIIAIKILGQTVH